MLLNVYQVSFFYHQNQCVRGRGGVTYERTLGFIIHIILSFVNYKFVLRLQYTRLCTVSS